MLEWIIYTNQQFGVSFKPNEVIGILHMSGDENILVRFQAIKQPPCRHDDVQLQQSHGPLVGNLILLMKKRPASRITEMIIDCSCDDISISLNSKYVEI